MGTLKPVSAKSRVNGHLEEQTTMIGSPYRGEVV